MIFPSDGRTIYKPPRDTTYNGILDFKNIEEKWRRRVEVESTTRSAKERVAGFEGREGHRTPFAPMGV